MGHACSSCCHSPHRERRTTNRRRNHKPLEKPLTDPSPVFPTDMTSASFHLSSKRNSLVITNSTACHTHLGHSPSSLATPSTTNGDHHHAHRLSRLSSASFGGVPATLAIDPLGGVSTTLLKGGGGSSSTEHASSLGGMKSFVSRIPPLGRSGSGEFKSSSETKAHNLFNRYKDPTEDAILTKGMEALCMDLELKPEEYKVLVFAWKCHASQMCRFTRAEFLAGCRALRADSIKGIQARLPEAAVEASLTPELFKDLYRFTFSFGLEPGQKVLPVDMAVSLWQLVFSRSVPSLLPRWIGFLRERPGVIRGIPRDTWNMFLNLTEAVGDDLGLYDDNEAWPSLFDDFVEHENDRANQNVRKDGWAAGGDASM